MKAPVPQLPPGLTAEDMPGGDGETRRMKFSLYRRGLLSPVERRNILKRLAARTDTAGEG